MNLEELQSVQSGERQASSLQHLRPSFYQDAGEFVRELRDRRDDAAAAADDPFASEEVRRLTDDIETAEQTVEAIYERRVGKVVKMASIAAADMPYDDDGLTREEEALFETLVASIEENRETVLSVLDGDVPGLTCQRPDDPAGEDVPPDAGRPAAPETRPSGPQSDDSTGVPTGEPALDRGEDAAVEHESPPPDTPAGQHEQPPTAGSTATADSTPEDAGLDIGGAMGGSNAEPESTEREGASPTPAETPAGAAGESVTEGPGRDSDSDRVSRTTVRITAEVGDIFGVDGRAYDLSSEDVVTLPEENATILADQGHAERLE